MSTNPIEAAAARWRAESLDERADLVPDVDELVAWLMADADQARRSARPVSVDAEAVLEHLGHDDVCQALEVAGWRPAGGVDGQFRRYYWPGPTEDATIVPVNPHMADYRAHMDELLFVLRWTAKRGRYAMHVIEQLNKALAGKQAVVERQGPA